MDLVEETRRLRRGSAMELVEETREYRRGSAMERTLTNHTQTSYVLYCSINLDKKNSLKHTSYTCKRHSTLDNYTNK